MAPFVGFPLGVFQGGSGSPFIAAELHQDVSLLARGLDDIASKKLSQAMTVAMLQTLDDIATAILEGSRGKYQVRTSVLDISTCDICHDLNGLVVRIDSAAHAEYDPANGRHCRGGHRCRCVYDTVRGGETGFEVSTRVTESSMDAVRGEVAMGRARGAELGSEKLRAIAKTRSHGHDERETGHSLLDSAAHVEAIELQRIVQDYMTLPGKPQLSRNTLSALQYLAATGSVPPLTYRSPRGLVRL